MSYNKKVFEDKQVLYAADLNEMNDEIENSSKILDSRPALEKGISENCIQQTGSTAGCMGYYVKSIDTTNKKVYLSNKTTPQIPDISEQDNTIEGFESGYSAGDKLTFRSTNGTSYRTIKSVNKNVIEYEEDWSLNPYTASPSQSYHYSLTVRAKPNVGIASIIPKSFALGDNCIASGINSFVSGYNSQAWGDCSTAFGQSCKATSNYSHAEGNGTTASGTYGAHAEGDGAKALGNRSHAEGHETNALANCSHAEGVSTESSGYASHAEGRATKALGNATHAEGYTTIASGDYSHTEGHDTESSGYASHAEGRSTKSSGSHSHAEGVSTESSGYASHAEGNKTVAKGKVSHIEGSSLTTYEKKDVYDIDGVSFYSGTSNTTELETDGDGAYLIQSADDLMFFATRVAASQLFSTNKTFKLTVDIIWNEGDANLWKTTPPTNTWSCGSWGQPFKGTFDGQGHTISGLYGTTGLLGVTEGTVSVKNLSIINSFFNSSSGSVGSFVGMTKGGRLSVENVYSTAIVTGGNPVGGIVGRVHAATSVSVLNAVFAGSVEGSTQSGGIVGGFQSANGVLRIQNCLNHGSVKASSGTAGGIFGGNTIGKELSITQCINLGKVTGSTSNEICKPGVATNFLEHENVYVGAQFKYEIYLTEEQIRGFGQDELDYYGIVGTNGFINDNQTPIVEPVNELISNSLRYENSCIIKTWEDGAKFSLANSVATHVEGSNCIALSPCAHVEGNSTKASGMAAHAEGVNTESSGYASHAKGYHTKASGYASHAEGNTTIASGDYSHAEGYYTRASGYASHAKGYHTKASGYASHAEGDYTEASGSYSHAEGEYTKATISSQHVQGRYNVQDDTKVHIVGWGSSDTSRKNIHTIDTEGNAYFAGHLTIGAAGYGTTLPETGVEGQLFFKIKG